MWPFTRRNGATETKEHPNGAAFVMGGGNAWARQPTKAKQYMEEGYQLNVIVYRGVSEIAKAAGSIGVELYGANGEAIEAHPVLDLLQRPTPMMTWQAWLTEMLVNRMVIGEAACVAPSDGPPAEIWPLNPLHVEVVPGRGGIPSEYVHNVNNRKVSFPVDPMTGASNMMFIKTYNPTDYWRGQSPLMAAALAADTHNAGLRWNYSLLENSARPSGLVRFKGTYPSQEVIHRMREYFKARMTGARNAGEIPMLAEDAEWVSLSQTAREMDFVTTMQETAKYVASALGVPLPLIDNDASTFNNLEQAKERLYTDTVIPVLQEIIAGLNNWLLPRYGDGLELRLDLDTIPALEGLRERMFQRAVTAYEKGVLTLQEARVLMGYEPEGDGEFKPIPGAGMFDLPPDDVKALAYGLGDIETKAEGHKPTAEMARAAERALEWRREYGRGGTEVGVARARNIANRDSLSMETVNRMVSFFARHAGNRGKHYDAKEPDGGPTAWRIAWDLWGGDAGKAWAERIAAQDDD